MKNKLREILEMIPETPEWLSLDSILILTTSLLIFIFYISKIIDRRWFKNFETYFFLIISFITIIAVCFQIYKAYKKDKIIQSFKIQFLLQVNTKWDEKDFGLDGSAFHDLEDMGKLTLEKHNSKEKNIFFYSNLFNTYFSKGFPDKTGHILEEMGVISLDMKSHSFFSLTDRNIDIFKGFSNFKIFVKSEKISRLKNPEILFIQAEVKIYMNGSLRSSFRTNNRSKLSVSRSPNNTLNLSFDIKDEYGDVFHLLDKRIKSKTSLLKDVIGKTK